MRNVKRYLILALALAMLVSAMSLSAFATGYTPVNVSDHTYSAYKIFTGTQKKRTETNKDNKLGEIEWGDGINKEAFLQALKDDKTLGSKFAACTSAKDVAKVVATFTDGSADALAFAKVAYANRTSKSTTFTNNSTTLVAGYYLMVDNFDSVDQENAANNLALLKMSEDGKTSIESKVSVPTMTKKVKDKNDTTGAETGWQDTADHDIGDHVPFQLKAKLAKISDYETYQVVFCDTISDGLTYDGNAELKIDGTTVNDDFYVTKSGNKMTFSCKNVLAHDGHDDKELKKCKRPPFHLVFTSTESVGTE